MSAHTEQDPGPAGPVQRPEQPSAALRLLDTFELRVDGEPVTLPCGSQRLLAFLAVTDHPVPRDHAAFALWSDRDEERAFGNLRSALWRIRSAAASLVEADTARLRLAGHVRTDLAEALGGAEAVLNGELPGSVADVRTLLTSGDLLSDWCDPWLTPERERLRQLRLHALEAMCTQLLEAGDNAGAVDLGLSAVCSEPLRESAHRVLIRAHLAEGNPAEALRQYERYRCLVFDELSILPSILMEELVAPVRTLSLGRPRMTHLHGGRT